MALNIRNAQAERLAARVVTLTGETKTAASPRPCVSGWSDWSAHPAGAAWRTTSMS